VLQDPQALQVQLEPLDQQDPKAYKEFQDRVVLQVQQEFKDPQAPQAPLDQQGLKDFEGKLVLLARQVR